MIRKLEEDYSPGFFGILSSTLSTWNPIYPFSKFKMKLISLNLYLRNKLGKQEVQRDNYTTYMISCQLPYLAFRFLWIPVITLFLDEKLDLISFNVETRLTPLNMDVSVLVHYLMSLY